MGWVLPKLGGNAIVYAGFGTRDHARAAIQAVSGHIPTKVVYEGLGWVCHNQRWLYLHAGGIIGTDPQTAVPPLPDTAVPSKSLGDQDLRASFPIGPIIDDREEATGVEVRVYPALQYYRLPVAPVGEELVTSIQETLLTLKFAVPERIFLIMLAAVFRIALAEVRFGIHIAGRTNIGKTEVASLFASFFGAGLDSEHLPGSFISTANQILALCSQAGNVLLPVDDFVPTGSPSDMERTHRTAEQLYRSVGNRAGRGRCSRDGTPREGKRPRCLPCSTGEEVLLGHSLNARALTLELISGDVLYADTENLCELDKQLARNKSQLLTIAQDQARSGLSAQVMSAFLTWAAPQYEQLVTRLHEQKVEFRDVFAGSGRLPRQVDIAADLLAGFEVFLTFCQSVNALSEADSAEYQEKTQEALETTLDKQKREVAEHDPVKAYLKLLATAFTTGSAYLKNRCSYDNVPPRQHPQLWGWEERSRVEKKEGAEDNPVFETVIYYVSRGDNVGWISDNDAFIDVEASLAKAQRLAKESNLRPLPLTTRSLGKALAASGKLLSQSKDHYTAKIPILGVHKRVLHISSSAFYEFLEDDVPDQEELVASLARRIGNLVLRLVGSPSFSGGLPLFLAP